MAIRERVPLPCDNGKSRKNNNNDTDNKKILVVSQEIKFARVLAGNHPKARDRALKNLRKWLENRSKTVPFTEDDFMRIWKGLFYSMWMADKPLIQEECAENVSSLLHSLPTDSSLLFFKSGLITLINEWFGIDQLRLDKFLMLVRRWLRQGFVVLKNTNFQKSSIEQFTKYISETILKTKTTNTPIGLLMHFIDIYLEELAKICGNDLNINQLPLFLIPFIEYLSLCDDDRLLQHINDNIFIYLIKQSDLGLEYQAKYNVWRQQQFHGTIDDVKKIEITDDSDNDNNDDDDDDNNNDNVKIYDPRAGRIDVELPQLKFDPMDIVKTLSEYKSLKGSTLKARKIIIKLIELFKIMSNGQYPIGVKQLNIKRNYYNDTNINKAVKRLIDFDDEIMDRKPKRQQQNGEILKDNREEKMTNKRKIQNNNNKDDTSIKSIKKRRLETLTNSLLNRIGNIEKVESIFERNSGIWVVTNEIPQTNPTITTATPTITNNDNKTTSTKVHNKNKENKSGLLKTIDKKSNNRKLNQFENKKKLKKILTNKDLMKNLDGQLINNLTIDTNNSQLTKKVIINTKLNTSQDVSEHQAQIKSSPAIPYDASKKPIKPLLKTPPISNRINPFYNCL